MIILKKKIFGARQKFAEKNLTADKKLNFISNVSTEMSKTLQKYFL